MKNGVNGSNTYEVYEALYYSCRRLLASPVMSGPTPWYFEGMSSHKPMWALYLLHPWPAVLGFVWETSTDPNNPSTQEITGVSSELWRSDPFLVDGIFEQPPAAKNLLGRTPLSLEQIQDVGQTVCVQSSHH